MSTLTPMRHERDRNKIVGRLRDVADLSHDVVGPAKALRFQPAGPGANLFLDSPVITNAGTWSAIGLETTRTAYRQAADRLNIPVRYLDQLVADDQRDLASLNLNRRAQAVGATTLFRLLNLPDGWQLRGVLSESYQAIDNMDVLAAVIHGMSAADQNLDDAEVEADWTDDRFRLRIGIPAIQVLAPELLGDYRSPFSTRPGTDAHAPAQPGEVPPILFAGIEVSNSETGNGAVSLAPRAVVLACRNGMTRNVDIVRAIHLGSKLEAGVVAWSHATKRKAVELIQSKVTDAVRQFCSVEYLTKLVDEMRAAKGLQVNDVAGAFERVRVDLGFSEAEINAALTCFTRSGDTSVLGLGQAVTAAAQAVEDGDRQSEMEQSFWQIVARPAAFVG